MANDPILVVKDAQTWEAIVQVSAAMPGKFADWPANIQDGFLRGKEKLEKSTGEDFEIVDSISWIDDDGAFAYVMFQCKPKFVRLQ